MKHFSAFCCKWSPKWAHGDFLWRPLLPWLTHCKFYHITLTKRIWPSKKGHGMVLCGKVCGNSLLQRSCCLRVTSPCLGLKRAPNGRPRAAVGLQHQQQKSWAGQDVQPIRHMISVHQHVWLRQPSECYSFSFPHSQYCAHLLVASSHCNHTRKRNLGNVYSRLN